MVAPLSTKRDFVEFCYRVTDADPLAAMEAACEEIGWHRRANKLATGRSDFRAGSKGRIYCDQLQHLVSLLMNGQVPVRATSNFHHDVAPLVKRLLVRWDISGLRQAFPD